jgi:hypothetical protein
MGTLSPMIRSLPSPSFKNSISRSSLSWRQAFFTSTVTFSIVSGFSRKS